MKRLASAAVAAALAAFTAPAFAHTSVPGQVLTAAQLDSQFALYVPLAGGTLTGPLTVPSLSVTGSPMGFASGGTGATTALAATSNLQYNQGGTGAVTRSLAAKLQDYIVAQDYGVQCNGTTINTTPLTNALHAAQAAGKPLYIAGSGTCLTDWINYGSVPIANQVSIISDGATLQKYTADGKPVVTIGSPTATHYTGPIVIRGLTFSGIAGNTPASLQMYDVVRSSFENDTFENAIAGNLSYGGISNDYRNVIFENNQIGFHADTFSSDAGGGVPNLITLDGSKFVDNSSWGIYFNGGNQLLVKNFDIEGNGTRGTSSSGGAYISAVSTGKGATFDSGWFEANAGGQNLWLNGGYNDVRSAMFIASPNATYDINITAGNYALKNDVCVNNKRYNVYENGAATGNTIDDTFCPNLYWSAAHTKLFTPSHNSINGNTAIVGSISASTTGSMPLYGTTGTGVNAPHMVNGTVALSSGSATVTLSGSAVYTSSSSYTCTANDTTSAAAVKVGQTSGTSITLTGTSADTVQFLCAGS